MRTFVLAIVSTFLLTAWTPKSPPGVATLFSDSFQMSGLCTGREMVYRWSVNGAEGGGGLPPPSGQKGASFIYPWLPVDITIRGVELTELLARPGAESKFAFLMLGNNADGDTMIFLDANQTHGVNWFPAGTGFAFPGTMDMTPLTYIDLHGSCTKGNHVNVVVTIYYTTP
jgi:hypothetical protein